MRTYADPPVTFVRGQGTVLVDADGTEYLDFITGLAVVSLGHAHPAVADAVAEQARTLSHVSNLYGNTLAPEVVVHVPYDDVAALDKVLDPGTVAAVLLEPLQGEGGVMVPSSDYLGAVRSLCTERNALLMLDEVQTGLGRTGHWFAFQAQGLEPDVVTIAKALGNGMPVGACWARAEVAAAFGPGDHGSTFGGQPLAMAAAKATLAVMEAEDVCGRARRAGARMAAGLAALPGVVSVRGAGLLLAAQLASP